MPKWRLDGAEVSVVGDAILNIRVAVGLACRELIRARSIGPVSVLTTQERSYDHDEDHGKQCSG
jgi:hypothetical protein